MFDLIQPDPKKRPSIEGGQTVKQATMHYCSCGMGFVTELICSDDTRIAINDKCISCGVAVPRDLGQAPPKA